MGSIEQAISDRLTAALPTVDILTAGSPAYRKWSTRFLTNTEKQAAVIAFPSSSHQVAELVRFATAHSLDLAVCSGGHSASGASSTDGGLCINLSKMRSVSLNVDGGLCRVRVQGGALWQDVYATLDGTNLGVVGGLANTVGVGGSALMGGYGWLTGAHGLALDSIVTVEAVLADGSVVTLSETENTDLYWAFRGAGPCFGIATSMDLRVYEKHQEVMSGALVFQETALTAVVQHLNHMLRVSKGESSVLLILSYDADTARPMIVLQVYYEGSEEEAREFFAPLYSQGPISDTTKMVPFSRSALEDLPAGPGYMSGGAIMEPLDSEFIGSLLQDLAGFVDANTGASHSALMFELHPTGSILRHKQSDTAFPNRGRFGNVLIYAPYSEPDAASAYKDWCQATHDKVRREFERRRLSDELDETTKSAVGEYINYDGKLL